MMAEEMRHITKAMGFTGNTIKRWLATSPRPNDDQTEEMAEPTTPVPPLKDEVFQFNGANGRSGAPRKKSFAVRLSSSRSGSIPSASSNEEQTPSQSPKIIFQSSIDGRVFAEADDADDTIDRIDSAIKDPVRIFVHFSFNGEVDLQRPILSLNNSRHKLNTTIAKECAKWRASQSELMHLLHSQNKCVHMLANISFGDFRDIYVDGNEQECYRFDTLRDFFQTEELYFLQQTGHLPCIPIIVNVEVEASPDGGGVSEYLPPRTPKYAHHRIGGWVSAPSSSTSQHSALHTGLYAQYSPTTGAMQPKLIEIRERFIDDSKIPIGALTNPHSHDRIPNHESLEPKYQTFSVGNGELFSMIKKHVKFNADFKIPEKSIAYLPKMTFDELQRPEGKSHTDSISNEPIHLAVRFVNALPGHLQKIFLPTNTLLNVVPGKGTKAAIEHALKVGLHKFGKGYLFDCTSIGKLFHEKMGEDDEVKIYWGGYCLDLWVLPQGGEDRRMRLFQRGSLKWFLDPKRAEEGDRRLYVEAWILKGEDEMVLEVVRDGEDE